MIKKITISALGLILLGGTHALINIFLLNREQELTMAIMPLFMIIYFVYLQLIIRKYLKL